MMDRQTIMEKVRASADRYGPSNPQQIKQLISSLGNAPERELFFGLFSFFYDPDLQENSVQRQQLAGAILFEISPPCPLELDGAIYAIPKYWDLSIEEDDIKKSFKTMLFWANGYQ